MFQQITSAYKVTKQHRAFLFVVSDHKFSLNAANKIGMAKRFSVSLREQECGSEREPGPYEERLHCLQHGPL